jgi:deoxycytidylate deaminase
MELLTESRALEAQRYLTLCASVALQATCLRAKGGSVIVKDGTIIGTGYNTPPFNSEIQRRCTCNKHEYHQKVTDKTCCVHAEQRAIIDALKNHPDQIQGSTIYYVRLGDDDKPVYSGKPYCTICSKLALDVGISQFVLEHEQGIISYDTGEYNLVSYRFTE